MGLTLPTCMEESYLLLSGTPKATILVLSELGIKYFNFLERGQFKKTTLYFNQKSDPSEPASELCFNCTL